MVIDYLIAKNNLKQITTNDFSYAIYTCNNPHKAKKDPAHQLVLLKLNGSMNTSGLPLAKRVIAPEIFGVTNFKIICDDLETDLGVVKNSWIGGDRGHNGIKSLNKYFKNEDYEKIKVGIGRPTSKDPNIVANYVVGKFNNREIDLIKAKAYPKIENYLNLKC